MDNFSWEELRRGKGKNLPNLTEGVPYKFEILNTKGSSYLVLESSVPLIGEISGKINIAELVVGKYIYGVVLPVGGNEFIFTPSFNLNGESIIMRGVGGISVGLSGGVVPPPPSTDFIIRVKTDNVGTSNDDQFTLPTTTGTYDYSIDWGDGVVEDINVSTSQTHTYPVAGEYTIKISGTFPRIFFNNGGDRSKLIETINFGDVGWTSMLSAFHGCNNMTISPTCTGVMPSGSYQFAWRNCSSLTSFPALDLSGGTNFSSSWRDCSSMTSFNATALGSGSYALAWFGCSSLTSFPALDLSGGTSFSSSWQGCSSMTSFDATALGSGSYANAWFGCSSMTSFPALDLSGGTSFANTWQNCTSMTSFPALDLSGGTDFNSTWRNMGILTSFATRNFYNMTNGTNCFNGTTLPTADCSDIYITQRANNANTGVSLHMGNSKYNASASTARGELVSIQSWSLIDGGLE
jgi:hypothetical protein